MLKRYFRYLRSAASKMYQADILDLLEPNPDASLLDIGCDDGKWTACLLSKIGCHSVIGIDLVDQCLLKAKKNAWKLSGPMFPTVFPSKTAHLTLFTLTK